MHRGKNIFIREDNIYLQGKIVFYIFILLQIAEKETVG